MKRKKGTIQTNRPRISVFRSNQYIYAQIIDDARGVTLASASDFSLSKKGKSKEKIEKKEPDMLQTRKIDVAYSVGMELAQKAKELKITRVRFDRGTYKYHGRIRALAEGARNGGLEF